MPTDDEDLVERAKVISEATGRDLTDVIADLADDGILNHSNHNQKDLITQLKEAAELIDTVQDINRQVAQNTVLNGGKNTTEVAVETTLEGDIVDRAIASAQRKAESIKKLALILAPVFLLITGGTMESFGLINLFSDDDGDGDDDDYYYTDDYGGCLDSAAWNYDPYASWDDGSCEYDSYECNPDWSWSSSYGHLEGESLRTTTIFEDYNQCGLEQDGNFVVQINQDGEYYDSMSWDNRFVNRWEAEYLWQDLPVGEYDVEYWAYMDGSSWHQNMDERFTIECDADLTHDNSSAQVENDNDIHVSMRIKSSTAECIVNIEVMVSAYKDDAYEWTIEYGELGWYEVDGEIEIVITDSRLEDLPYGSKWSFETRFMRDGDGEDCCYYTNDVFIS